MRKPSWLIIFALITLIATTGSAATRSKQLADPSGQVSLTASSETELRGSFMGASGQQIEFQILVGEENNHGPDAPSHAVDIMISDQHGPFLVQVGGDAFIDPGWNERLQELNTESFAAAAASFDRSASFAATHTLSRLVNSGGVAQLQGSAMRQLMNSSLRNLINGALGPNDVRVNPELEGLLDQQPPEESSYGYFHHKMEIREKGAFHESLHPWFEHSSTIFRSYWSNWSLAYTYVTCNHGTCATDPVMRLTCWRYFFNRPSFYVGGLQDRACDYWSHIAPIPGFHVCNDDSYHQYWTVKYNLPHPYHNWTCNDTSLRTRAPSCF